MFQHGENYEKRKKEASLDICTGSRTEDNGAQEGAPALVVQQGAFGQGDVMSMMLSARIRASLAAGSRPDWSLAIGKAIAPVLVFGALLCAAQPALAQFIQQGPKLVGSGAVGNAAQGYSVAVSADGNTAIVGGSQDNANTGATWVFTRSGGVWSPQGPKLVGSGAVGLSA
jgi:hypothetical protein